MALSTPDSSRLKLNAAPKMSRKVRIVGKIRKLSDQEIEILGRDPKPWVAVCRSKETDSNSSGKVTISFGDEGNSRKDRYELDNCYEQNEDNATVFSREVEPLISEIFNGQNASIIAYGARGSGKTHTIQGCEDKQGLAAMAIAEILSRTKDAKKTVFVSFYEVLQDHVYDLLDPDHPEVQVLEDSQGKIKLKGLSKIAVDSISRFQDLCTCWSASPCYSVQKTPLRIPKRSHKGLMIQIASLEDSQGSKGPNVMNFVDLTGYEDSRRSSKDGTTLTESTRINRSLYAIMNVVYALNTNEKRVPYRETKLTRMLQEFLGGSNHVLLLTCLNPTICQDTIYAVSLASRSCQTTAQSTSSTIKSKKQTNQQVRLGGTPLSGIKNNSGSNLVGRRLFITERKKTKATISKQDDVTSSTKFKPLPEDASTIMSSLHEKTSQDKSGSDSSNALISLENETQNAFKETISVNNMEKDATPPNKADDLNLSHEVDCDIKEIITSGDDGDADIEKENGGVNIVGVGSPPLSERLRQLANNFRLLDSSTPSHILMPKQLDASQESLESCGSIIEPKTPEAETYARNSDKLEITKYTSPWERFHTRSSGVKNCLVQEFLSFLNTASKEELTRIQGIGEKRAVYILELREEFSEPFRTLEDLQEVGLSAKEINGLLRRMAGQLFS